jgi:hypothetical protein
MFGNAGKSPGGFSFSPSSTQSFQNAGAMTGFGSAQTQQPGGGNVQLLTKDNRPVAHSSKWEDLSPQAQQYLLELEYVDVSVSHCVLLFIYLTTSLLCRVQENCQKV